MRMERLTSKLQSALADAQSLAIGKDNSQIEPAHLMLALIDQKGGSVRPLLMQVGFDVNTLRADLVGMVEQLPQVSSPTGDIQTSQPLYRMLNLADKKAQQAGDQFISSETMLLVMMEDSGPLGKLLGGQGVSQKALENAIKNIQICCLLH